jgi:hypothetical protein
MKEEKILGKGPIVGGRALSCATLAGTDAVNVSTFGRELGRW